MTGTKSISASRTPREKKRCQEPLVSLLEVLAALAADTEPDGDVDGADFLTLQRENPSLIPSWQTEYGSGATLLAAGTAVPEPLSHHFLLAILTVSLPRRRMM